MEGVRVFEKDEWESKGVEAVDLARDELRTTLEGLARHLFGDVEMRWVDAYFPSRSRRWAGDFLQGRVAGGARVRRDGDADPGGGGAGG